MPYEEHLHLSLVNPTSQILSLMLNRHGIEPLSKVDAERRSSG
jgi:hypothetical protein